MYNWIYSSYSAGVDCVGFVYMSASYKDNNIILSEQKPFNWGDVEPYGSRRIDFDPRMIWMISKYSVKAVDTTSNLSRYINIEKFIPGDIIFYNEYSFAHVMMILSIDYEEGERETSPLKIKIIEATTNYGMLGQVYNLKKLKNLVDSGRYWVSGRLMIKKE